ncbi:MAG: hypothetical protein HY678_09940 [Chloroflexi bacterium]|nr:hypothetical protein [Chloroflexota bacterium]
MVATGGSHRKLGVPGEEQLAGRGVSCCAVCDGNFFRGKDVVVVGGGDATLDEGLYLTGITSGAAFKTSNMKFLWSHVCREIKGNDVVDRVLLEDLKTSG